MLAAFDVGPLGSPSLSVPWYPPLGGKEPLQQVSSQPSGWQPGFLVQGRGEPARPLAHRPRQQEQGRRASCVRPGLGWPVLRGPPSSCDCRGAVTALAHSRYSPAEHPSSPEVCSKQETLPPAPWMPTAAQALPSPPPPHTPLPLPLPSPSRHPWQVAENWDPRSSPGAGCLPGSPQKYHKWGSSINRKLLPWSPGGRKSELQEWAELGLQAWG